MWIDEVQTFGEPARIAVIVGPLWIAIVTCIFFATKAQRMPTRFGASSLD